MTRPVLFSIAAILFVGAAGQTAARPISAEMAHFELNHSRWVSGWKESTMEPSAYGWVRSTGKSPAVLARRYFAGPHEARYVVAVLANETEAARLARSYLDTCQGVEHGYPTPGQPWPVRNRALQEAAIPPGRYSSLVVCGRRLLYFYVFEHDRKTPRREAEAFGQRALRLKRALIGKLTAAAARDASGRGEKAARS